LENYQFEPAKNGTQLAIEVDTQEDYFEYFDAAWPKALEKLKTVCEESK